MILPLVVPLYQKRSRTSSLDVEAMDEKLVRDIATHDPAKGASTIWRDDIVV